MSAYLEGAGIDAPLCPADELIVTDEVSGNAKPFLDETRQRVQRRVAPLLDRGAIVIVPGFYGVSLTGKLTTLGRGGSDLTAAVLGHCLDAAEVSLWKVEYTTTADGWMDRWQPGWQGVVHDADPRVTIPALAYEEAAELAHFGKKVLHPETVQPAVEKRIPIRVRSTIDPSHPGTRIHAIGSVGSAAAPPAGPDGSGAGPAAVRAITKVPLQAYEAKNGRVVEVDAGPVHRDAAALVALVGVNVLDIPGLQERATGVLAAAGIPCYVPRRVNGSVHNLTLVVPDSQRNQAVSILHAAFLHAPEVPLSSAAVQASTAMPPAGSVPPPPTVDEAGVAALLRAAGASLPPLAKAPVAPLPSVSAQHSGGGGTSVSATVAGIAVAAAASAGDIVQRGDGVAMRAHAGTFATAKQRADGRAAWGQLV